MICEYCGSEHDGAYGSGRFCDKSCACGFSTRDKRDEISRKVSKTLGGSGLTSKERLAAKKASYKRERELTSILDVSSRTTQKILKRMGLPCFRCGWLVEGVVGDLHHILPKKHGGEDVNSNLTYICPNCHRLVHSGVVDANELVSLEDYLGDSWKEYYFTK